MKDQRRLSYRWILNHQGTWTLSLQKTVFATGKLDHFDASQWHNLKVVFNKTNIQGWVDGQKLADVQNATEAEGMADLATSYDPNLFTNLAVTPIN